MLAFPTFKYIFETQACVFTPLKPNEQTYVHCAIVFCHIENLTLISQITQGNLIQSLPGKRVCPVSNSAIIHPTDQMSAAE